MQVPKRWWLTPHDTALLIVDAQNDFLAPGGGLNELLADQLKKHQTIDRIKSLLNAARLQNMPVLFSRMEFSSGDYVVHEVHHLSGFNRMIFDLKLFAQESWGAEFYGELLPTSNDIVLSPHTSIDAFYSNLPDHLGHLGTEKLILAGACANGAVLATVNTARERGFETIVASDAIVAPTQASYDHALQWTLPYSSTLLLTADEICDLVFAQKHLMSSQLLGAVVHSSDGGWIGNVSELFLEFDETGYIQIRPANPSAAPIYIPENCVCKASEKKIYLNLPGRLIDQALPGWFEDFKRRKEAA